jgi:hypothetical protein
LCCFGGGVAAGLPAWAIREVPLETRQGPSTYHVGLLRLGQRSEVNLQGLWGERLLRV